MSNDRRLVCPPPGPERIIDVRRAIDSWTNSTAIQELVRIFGGEWRDDWSSSERLSFLEGFSERWDFRRGVERLDAATISLDLNDQSAVENAAAELGLTMTVPPMQKSYDYVLVLGGVAMSCRLRTEYAAEIVQQGNVAARAVLLLGALRRIPDNERSDADSFAPGSETEFDMLNAVAESAFQLHEEYTDSVSEAANDNLVAIVRRYHRSASPNIISLCAPSSDPVRRANTEDTYAFFAQIVNLQPDESVLICTSQIYYPFHLMGSMRMLALPYNVKVEVVGFPIDRAVGNSALRGTHNLLQEVRSGILAAVKLNQFLDSTL